MQKSNSDIYLVTSPIEETWPIDNHIVFLGNWCLLYNRKFYWSNLDYKVENYHWSDRSKYQKDYHYLSEVNEILLIELTSKLNEIHNVNHSIRYWRILIGPWIRFFTQVLFDRWFALNQVIKNNQVSKCIALNIDTESLIPNDMRDFGSRAISDNWNEGISTQLIRNFFSNNISIEYISGKKQQQASEPKKASFYSIKSEFRKFFVNLIYSILKRFYKRSEYFFIDTLLPRKFELKLHLKLKQFPKIWHHPIKPKVEADMRRRQWKLSLPNDDFYQVLNYMIPRHIPTIHIEGYKILSKNLSLVSWPQEPKAIVTANIIKNESVNMWIAEKVEQGVPLIVRQHGGVYGTCLFSSVEEHELSVSDYWLSWGWSNIKQPHIVPLCFTHRLGLEKVKYNPEGYALIVGLSSVRYSWMLESSPIAEQWQSYFDDQIRFVSALPETIKQNLMVRLHVIDHGQCQKERWNDYFPEILLDEGVSPLYKLVEKSRIYISTYNATTFLESLSWNMPTIIFWDPGFNELNETASNAFNELKKVGIFHETPESAAIKLIEVWDDIPTWWHSEEIQKARNNFCSSYSRTIINQVDEYAKVLQSLS